MGIKEGYKAADNLVKEAHEQWVLPLGTFCYWLMQSSIDHIKRRREMDCTEGWGTQGKTGTKLKIFVYGRG